MAGNTAIELLAEDPKEAHSSFSADTVAVLQLFNNIAYRAKTSDDTIVRCRKDKSGHYRVDGCLLLPIPLQEMLNPHMKNCIPLLG
jgi:hypothetical protein